MTAASSTTRPWDFKDATFADTEIRLRSRCRCQRLNPRDDKMARWLPLKSAMYIELLVKDAIAPFDVASFAQSSYYRAYAAWRPRIG
jgi:hypothetical protein